MINKVSIRIAAFLFLLFVFLGGGWLWWQDAISPVDPNNTNSQIFVVSPGETVRSIATRLKNEGLIKDQVALFLMVKIAKLDNSIQAGDFRLSPTMGIQKIIKELTHGTLDVWVTILEGWRVEETAMKLAQELVIPESEFLKYAQEGYMFPDTYLLPKEATAAAVVEIFHQNFSQRVTPEIKQAIISQGLTEEQGIILASIIEREGKTEADRPVIAGILIKRLKQGWPLQADATLQYALGYQSQEKSWWKKTLLAGDKKIDSPYNSYINVGLPPAPICNPGLAAIKAVGYPSPSSYWYYLHDKQGQVHYAETIDEHNRNISQYL